MEVTNALLVAMMFVMILSIGIGNILLSLPPLMDRESAPRRFFGLLSLRGLGLVV